MNLIDRYISRTILAATAMVALVVGALAALSVFIGEVDSIGEGSYGFVQVIAYTLLRMPSHLYLVLPVIALLGALLALGALAAGSELVVVRASGVSMARLAGSVSIAGIVLALLAVGVGEYLGPAGVRTGDALRDKAVHGHVADSIDDGLWLRQGNTVVRIDGTLPGGRIDGLDVYQMSADGRLERTVVADRAVLHDRKLVIEKPAFTTIKTDSTETGTPDTLSLDVDIDPKVLDLAVTEPSELSTLGLWRYIDYLQANEINADDYQLAFWRNVINPFTVWVLVVFALPFAFGSLRSASAGQRLFIGGLIGLVFFLVNEIVASTGPVYGVPPWLAASLPTVLLAVVTGAWMRRLS
ncbi:LPS export ABC transporter permease LptG [Salinisphaera aquimarina]|uniref:LPS export ABC transporter permease LptG n=1 Tax=Salinisphaera aquimarina TaxID=2094031 RepID=A0ABV7ET03_9GAMM